MGKSLNGKELGNGISQRKDGLYQARFINRFGKRQTIYAKTLNEVRHKLRTEQYNDEKAINVVDKNMTLDEWFDIWLSTCKKNCRSSTKGSYITHYKRIQEELGWRKLTSLNLIVMQEAFNKLKTDNARKNSKKILVDMLNKAVDTDLLVKNVAKQINTVIAKEEKKERRVLTIRETELFLEQAKGTFYENLFILALETGLRVGELSALQWEDIDFKKKVIHVKHTLCYFSKNGKYVFEMHDTKTNNGKRTIPLTAKAINSLKCQKLQKQEIILKGKTAKEEFQNLVFVTKNNQPTQQFLINQCMQLVIQNMNKAGIDFSPLYIAHTSAYFCYKSNRMWHEPQNIAETFGTWHITNDNGLVLSCNRRYAILGNGKVREKV